MTIAAAAVVVIMIALVTWIVLGRTNAASDKSAQAPVTSPATSPSPSPSPAQTPAGESSTSPAPSPTDSPSAVPSPASPGGEFGDLPAPEMPSGNPVNRRLSLSYRLDMSLQQIPGAAPVYQMQPKVMTLEQVTDLARQIGVTGDIVDQGSGSFRASGGGNLYVTENLAQYIAEANPPAGELPADDALIQSARSWLLSHNLLGGADIGPGSVQDRNKDAERATVVFKPIEPEHILSAIPSATVTIGTDGSIVEANVQWPASLRKASYTLRSADDLWADAGAGRGYVDIDPQLLPEGSKQLIGVATARSVSLAYTVAGNTAANQFLVPLVVFEGQAKINDVDAPVPVRIYVQSVSQQVAPRG